MRSHDLYQRVKQGVYYQGAEEETDINVIEEVSLTPGGRTQGHPGAHIHIKDIYLHVYFGGYFE